MTHQQSFNLGEELSKTLWLEFTGKGGHQFMGDLSFDEIVKRSFNQGREAGIREALEIFRNLPEYRRTGLKTLKMDFEDALSALLTQPPEGEQK